MKDGSEKKLFDIEEGVPTKETDTQKEKAVLRPSVSFEAEPIELVAFSPGPTLRGKTVAKFDGKSNVIPDPPKSAPAKGCEFCDDNACADATGVLAMNFESNPTVTLPDLAEFPKLTPCQRTNAQAHIDTVIKPHEQKHVATFMREFDGKPRRPFKLKFCSQEALEKDLTGIFTTELIVRRQHAQFESDVLDQNGKNVFPWDMDEGCSP